VGLGVLDPGAGLDVGRRLLARVDRQRGRGVGPARVLPQQPDPPDRVPLATAPGPRRLDHRQPAADEPELVARDGQVVRAAQGEPALGRDLVVVVEVRLDPHRLAGRRRGRARLQRREPLDRLLQLVPQLVRRPVHRGGRVLAVLVEPLRPLLHRRDRGVEAGQLLRVLLQALRERIEVRRVGGRPGLGGLRAAPGGGQPLGQPGHVARLRVLGAARPVPLGRRQLVELRDPLGRRLLPDSQLRAEPARRRLQRLHGLPLVARPLQQHRQRFERVGGGRGRGRDQGLAQAGPREGASGLQPVLGLRRYASLTVEGGFPLGDALFA
jgi:hypothetical protein